MPHRADTLTGLPRQMALALAITGMLASAAPAAAQQTASPTPRELWRTYPLQQGGGREPKIRLPAGSEARVKPTAPAKAAASGGGSGGGATLPIAAAVGLAALLAGLLLGRRRRVAMAGEAVAEPREEHAPAEPALRATPTAPPEPSPHAAADVPPGSPPRDAAPQPQPQPAHESPPATAAPSPPADAASPPPPLRPEPTAPLEPTPTHAAPMPPLRAAPEPPAREPLRAAPAPSPLELEVERLRTGRFERQPWPEGMEQVWRCEIGWHAGTLSAGFRAMAAAPGRRRAKEVGRSEPQRLWGSAPPEPPTAELVAAADGLAAALLDAGWEPVEGGGAAWYATRFAWPHAEPPPRGLRVRSAATTEQEAVHDA